MQNEQEIESQEYLEIEPVQEEGMDSQDLSFPDITFPENDLELDLF